jgi:hypothetical protein
MKRLLMAGTAITALFACSAAMAQPLTNTPALLRGPNYAAQNATVAAPTLDPGRRVSLGRARRFAILTETGITDVASSAITGAVGTSPITGAADLLSCAEVTGKILSVDTAGPFPCSLMRPVQLGRAVGAMQTAYTDAAGRTPTFTEVGGGNIGGLTLSPGVYSWSTGVTIPSNVTLNGGIHAVWIFQIAQDLIVSSGQSVVLSGNAQAKNVYWQVAGQAILGSTSHFEGNLLSKTLIALQTGASVKGRLLAQTAVTLQQNSVIRP